jgi:hypothetical protein
MDHILQHAPQKMRRFFITPQVKDWTPTME